MFNQHTFEQQKREARLFETASLKLLKKLGYPDVRYNPALSTSQKAKFDLSAYFQGQRHTFEAKMHYAALWSHNYIIEEQETKDSKADYFILGRPLVTIIPKYRLLEYADRSQNTKFVGDWETKAKLVPYQLLEQDHLARVFQ